MSDGNPTDPLVAWMLLSHPVVVRFLVFNDIVVWADFIIAPHIFICQWQIDLPLTNIIPIAAAL